MTQTLFISHSTKDDDAIDRIADSLEKAGYASWVDHRNGIVPGTPSWDRAIRAAITDCDGALFIMTGDSLASEICGSECLLVRELDKPLYVLRLREVVSKDVWLYIKQIQYADLAHDFEAGMALLLSALRGEKREGAPEVVRAKFSGRAALRLTLPYIDTNPLRGRADDLERLRASLDGGAHVVQVTGTGGTGKSRLAAEVALEHPTGALWHRCTANTTASDLLIGLAEHVGMKADTPRAALLAAFSRRPALVVVDNAEDVTQGARRDDYRELLYALIEADAPVILTTRVPWNELKPRREIVPTALDEATAAQIALDFAAAEQIALSADEARELATAARLYPRLIEWAVTQIPVQTGGRARVLRMLRDLKSHDVQAALDEMITRTLDDMVAQAHDGAAAQALLARLCIMPGSFDRHAALYLRQHEMVDEDELDDALTTLRTWRFVRDVGEERWRVEEVVRLAVRQVEDAFIPFVTHYTEAAAQFDSLPPEEWAATVERDIDNITAVGDLLVERRAAETPDLHKRAVAFASNITRYLSRRREVRRGTWLEMGLAAAQALGDAYRGKQRLFLGELGGQADAFGDKGAALRYNEQSLALARALGDKRNEATTLNNIGLVWRQLGEYQKALDYYEQALPMRREVGDKGGEAATLTNIGAAWSALGDKQKALDFFEQALPLLRAVGNKSVEATTLNNIGAVWDALGDKQKALDYFELALPLLRAVGNKTVEATTLNNIGAVWSALGDKHKALDYYNQALPLRRAVGDKSGEATTLNNIGGVWSDLGDKQKELDFYNQALTLRRAVGDKSGEAVTCFNLGLLHESLGDLDQAITYLERCVELDEQVQHPDLESDRAVLARVKGKRDGGNARLRLET
jgi:tetratricopeptide (TPR) repeat protein